MLIQQKETDSKGSLYIEVDGKIQAEMTYSLTPTKIMIIDHTEVGDLLRGKNAGFQMVEKAVQFAREKGYTIIPLCPFAKSVFEKKKDLFDDVLKK